MQHVTQQRRSQHSQPHMSQMLLCSTGVQSLGGDGGNRASTSDALEVGKTCTVAAICPRIITQPHSQSSRSCHMLASSIDLTVSTAISKYLGLNN